MSNSSNPRKSRRQSEPKVVRRRSDGFEFEDGGPPSRRPDDPIHLDQEPTQADGGRPSPEADVDGIPEPRKVKFSIGKWIKYHGPASASIPLVVIAGLVCMTICFQLETGGTTAGITAAVVTMCLTLALMVHDVQRLKHRRQR